jgi:hypothetical protein
MLGAELRTAGIKVTDPTFNITIAVAAAVL